MRGHVSQRYEPLEALNPDDGKLFTVKLSVERIHTIVKRGEGAVREMAFVVPEILTKPKAIFEGLRKDEDEKHNSKDSLGWRCYVGIPSTSITKMEEK